MAQRFGGKHSPDGTVNRDHAEGGGLKTARATVPGNAFDGKRRSRAGGRSNMLFAVPLLYIALAFRGEPASLVLGLGAAGLMLLGAWLTREGIFAHEAFDARNVARRPAFPRKIAGGILIGAGLMVGGLIAQQGILYPILFGLIGAGLHLISFGPDPLRDKGME
ncbi:MAG: hypothetical protein WCC57_06345, partial [Paracoccaceae bacterium]